MPTILDLPLEILWMVAENLEYSSDLNTSHKPVVLFTII
jgi:hypothetical protein